MAFLMVCFCPTIFGPVLKSFRQDEIGSTSSRVLVPDSLLSSAANYKWPARYDFRMSDSSHSGQEQPEPVAWKRLRCENRYEIRLRFDGTGYLGFQTWNKEHASRTIHGQV